MKEDVVPIEINDIAGRLLDLRAYSIELSRRMKHEDGLPDDPIPFLVNQLEKAFARCEAATEADRNDALEELGLWLVKSYQFYLVRLLQWAGEAPWRFRFPKMDAHFRQ